MNIASLFFLIATISSLFSYLFFVNSVKAAREYHEELTHDEERLASIITMVLLGGTIVSGWLAFHFYG